MNLDSARFTMENSENLAADSNVSQLVSPSKARQDPARTSVCWPFRRLC